MCEGKRGGGDLPVLRVSCATRVAVIGRTVLVAAASLTRLVPITATGRGRRGCGKDGGGVHVLDGRGLRRLGHAAGGYRGRGQVSVPEDVVLRAVGEVV
jgi:hypothetical protein